MAWIGVITNDGQELISEYAVPGSTLIITEVQTGSGSVEQTDMKESTALVTPVSEGYVVSIQKIDQASQMRLAVGPHTSSYTLREIGVFAKVGQSGEEKLLALIQDTDGVPIPRSADVPDFVLRLTVPLVISNTEDISFTVPPGAFTPYSEFRALVESVGDLYSLTVNQLMAKI